MEALDVALVRRPLVPEQHPGDEDREEARPVRDRRDAVDEAGEGQRPDRVERLARQGDPAHRQDERGRSDDADREPDRHLERELANDDPERRVRVGREVEHADHQRDPDRVVRPGFALEHGPAPPGDLTLAEHREHHRRVGRGKRGAEQPRRRPAEVEEDVREERHHRGGGERP